VTERLDRRRVGKPDALLGRRAGHERIAEDDQAPGDGERQGDRLPAWRWQPPVGNSSNSRHKNRKPDGHNTEPIQPTTRAGGSDLGVTMAPPMK
jgi:hypothetical protein